MQRQRVMVVDDSAAILTIIAAFLEGSMFEVVASERDGRRAVERYREADPDIVLLDLIMPGQSSMETLSQMLAIDPETCVVIVSSPGTENAVDECLAVGARSVLRKPITKQGLLTSLFDLDVAASTP